MLRTLLGFFFAFVAMVGAAALVEHIAQLKGEQWLNNVFPFGLATRPLWLAIAAVVAAAIAWLLLRGKSAP